MLKTCPICGRIHDINKVCRRPDRKKESGVNKFRNTYKWQQKREQIKTRDKHLCQVCMMNKYNTTQRYTYNDLEVHHIVPIEEDYSKRLDSDNLITLCRYHHEMAEAGEIPREELQELVARKYEPPTH